MQNSSSPPRFVVQCDWDVSIRTKSEKFWAGFKERGRSSVYCDFFPAPLEIDSLNFARADIVSSNPNISSTYDHKRRSLKIFNSSSSLGTTFLPPTAASGNLHQKSVYSIDVTSGGLGVSADSGGQLLVWETGSFELRRSLSGHLGDVYSCRFFPSGLVILSGGADMQLKIWSVETGECARTLIGHQQAITDVGFIERGRNIVSCSKDGTSRVWDCGSGTCTATFNANCGQVNALSIAGTSKKETVSSAEEMGTGNKLLVMGCENGTLTGFSLGDNSNVFRIKCPSAINTCVFYDENTVICGTEQGHISILDLRNLNSFLHVIEEDRGAVWSLCSVNRGYWASFGDGSVGYRSMEFTQSESRAHIAPCELELSGADCDPVYRVCTDGRHAYTSCRDGKIRRYHVPKNHVHVEGTMSAGRACPEANWMQILGSDVEKEAVNLRYKDGRQLALEHFDFYYKPLFRRQWPSIRLGLTSRSKTCCIVNNYGATVPAIISQFEEDGALDLTTVLEEAKNRRREREAENTISRQQRLVSDVKEEDEAVNEGIDAGDGIAEHEESRTAATLNQYIAPTKVITREPIQQWLEDGTEVPLDTWSPTDVQFIRDDNIVYPKHLRVFVRPLGDVTPFTDSVLDSASLVRTHQTMDAAALFPVFALDVRPNDLVLDLCAAPGEKTLALLQTLIPCHLVCNDVASVRVNLVKHNIRTYVPAEDVRDRIRFTRVNAKELPEDQIGAYDKVLVDVPNSEDRKSLRVHDREGNLFRRSQMSERLQLPEVQTEILIGGLKAVKRGGYLVYTTATLSPSQNDEVIETALRSVYRDAELDMEFAVCDLAGMAKDFYQARICRFSRHQYRYGQLILPYLPNNYGPVYTCKLKRVD